MMSYSWKWCTNIILEKIVRLYRNIKILSAADMSKRAMILLGQNEELKSLGFRMLFPVHDIYVNLSCLNPLNICKNGV